MQHTPFDFDTVLAISEGRHPDPFAVLGLHQIKGAWWVCAFDPGAEQMFVLPKTGAPIAGISLGVQGVFAAHVPAACDYRLRWQGYGTQWEQDDPCRFSPVLGALDHHLLAEGKHAHLWQVLGAQVMTHQGVDGTHFAVWAPNAHRVSVVGDFNHWDGRRAPMRKSGSYWQIFLPNVTEGAIYRYEVITDQGAVLKSDPVGFGSEHAPANASVVRDLRGAVWTDADWIAGRAGAKTSPPPFRSMRCICRLGVARAIGCCLMWNWPINWSNMPCGWDLPISNCCQFLNILLMDHGGISLWACLRPRFATAHRQNFAR